MDGRSQHLRGGWWLRSPAEALSIPGGTGGRGAIRLPGLALAELPVKE